MPRRESCYGVWGEPIGYVMTQGLSRDLVLPFILGESAVRGRLVRLGPLIDAILGDHDYPPPVAALLGEMLVLTAVLSALLKYDGIFTLQTKGDGPVGFCVADMTSEGALRGYASYDSERLAALESERGDLPLTARELTGDGYIAFTVDQGPETERYQGIVELTGETVTAFLQHYFRQSEQLKTGAVLAAGQIEGHWHGSALLVQEMPEASELSRPSGNREEDDWRRVQLLLATLGREELLDPRLDDETLLFRLFHEEGLRTFETRPLSRGCRCSRERIEGILRSLPREEVLEMQVEGEVVMTCEFCSIDFSL